MRLVGWSAGTLVLSVVACDGGKDIFNPSHDEPYRTKDALLQEKSGLLGQIATSRDAQQNAVTREKVAIVDRDLNQAYLDIVDHEGPILSRTRLFNRMTIGGVLPALTAVSFLRAVSVWRERRQQSPSSPAQASSVG